MRAASERSHPQIGIHISHPEYEDTPHIFNHGGSPSCVDSHPSKTSHTQSTQSPATVRVGYPERVMRRDPMMSWFLHGQPGGVDARCGEADHPALDLDRHLDRAIDRVIARDSCSGCGACVSFDSGLVMQENSGGYLRQLRRSAGRQSPGAVALFRRVCPGVCVSANASPGTTSHELLGAHLGVWKAWATDGEMRRIGSSGGVLTTLSAWLFHPGRTARVVSAATGSDPRRSVPVTITTREAALAAAGSRNAPVAVLSKPDTYLPGSIVVGKP